MSPRKTRRGKTRVDNGNESVSIIEDSMRELESPSVHSRSLRKRRNKDPPKEIPSKTPRQSTKPDSSPILNDSTRPSRRTRGRKTVPEPNESLNISRVLVENISLRKNAKKSKNEVIDESILPEETTESTKKKSRGRKKRNETSKSIIIDETKNKSSSDSDDNEVANVSSKILSKKSTNSRNRVLRAKNNSPSLVTPESSPITVPLTPHRTTKTPRKSPINLGSPKTHSLSPKRLSKTPRKLSAISASPIPSELSPVTPKKLLKSLDKPEKSPPNSSGKKGKNQIKLIVKTPRIVLRKSKSKTPPSKKSKKSPKSTDEAVKTEIKNNLSSPQLILKRINSPSKNDDDNNEKSTPSRPMITSRLHSVIKSEMTSSTPRERAREIRRSLNLSTGSSLLNVDKFYGSPKSPRSQFLEDETNPLISEDDSFEISGVKEVNDDNRVDKNGTYELAEPKTPILRREKNKHNDTYELEEPKTPGLRKRSGKRSLSEMNGDNCDDIDVAPKRMCRVRFATPEFKEKNQEREKSTPKVMVRSRSATPSSKLSKRNFMEGNNVTKRRRSNSLTNLSGNEESLMQRKRSLSVADGCGGGKEGKWNQKAQNESISRLSKPRLSISLAEGDKKRKSDKGNLSARKVPNFAQIHQKKFEKMESVVDAKKRVVERHNTLTSNNFGAKIGNDGNGKAEEAKSQRSGKGNFTPDGNKNGVNRFGFKVRDRVEESGGKKGKEEYNRFGFKVRKQEATKIIARPLAVKIQAKKEEKRMALKGVRSNRRFDLLMKSRNIQ